jgi:predicted cupin superfamily sugar epimerase
MMKSSGITAQQLIQEFSLQPHPEGGYYRQTYRSQELISHEALPLRFAGARAYSTAIYYLLPRDSKSNLHKIASDEIWHFYLGDPLEIVELSPTGELRSTVLGQDVRMGQKLQHVVPAGIWFGARPVSGSEYSFVGCTVAPGFDFADFEMADRSALLALHPQLRSTIELLTDR